MGNKILKLEEEAAMLDASGEVMRQSNARGRKIRWKMGK